MKWLKLRWSKPRCWVLIAHSKVYVSGEAAVDGVRTKLVEETS